MLTHIGAAGRRVFKVVVVSQTFVGYFGRRVDMQGKGRVDRH